MREKSISARLGSQGPCTVHMWGAPGENRAEKPRSARLADFFFTKPHEIPLRNLFYKGFGHFC